MLHTEGVYKFNFNCYFSVTVTFVVVRANGTEFRLTITDLSSLIMMFVIVNVEFFVVVKLNVPICCVPFSKYEDALFVFTLNSRLPV